MSTFLTLPTEIIQHIAEYSLWTQNVWDSGTESYDEKGILCALSLVSKELRALVSPLLFEEIHLSLSPPQRPTEKTASTDQLQAHLTNSKGFLANGDLTRLAKYVPTTHMFCPLANLNALLRRLVVRLPQTSLGTWRRDSLDIDIPSLLRPVLEVLQRCSQLLTIRGLSAECFASIELISAINRHPSIKTAWIPWIPSRINASSHLSTVLAEAFSNDPYPLRKFRCDTIDQHSISGAESNLNVLDLGCRAHHVHAARNHMDFWFRSPYLDGAEELTMQQCHDANPETATRISDVLQKHPSLTKLRLKLMPYTLFCLLQIEPPPFLSRFINDPGSIQYASFHVDNVTRKLTCTSIKLRMIASSDRSTHVDVTQIMDEIFLTFPSLKELWIEFPGHVRFPDSYNYEWELLPEQVSEAPMLSYIH